MVEEQWDILDKVDNLVDPNTDTVDVMDMDVAESTMIV